MLHDALIYLAGAVVSVLLFRRLGLGSVLGYLAAGVVIGPSGFGFIGEVESVLHVAELGVVLLLFLIGLELQPTRLWAMRTAVFGMGSLQVVATGGVFALIGMALGLGWPTALIVGAGLSLSSTAFAVQLLAEKDQLRTQQGRAAFGILLFQDLAVIPLLAALPLLGTGPRSHEPWYLGAGRVAVVLVLVVLAGRYIARPIFRAVAKTHSQELFTATALFIVVGTAAAVSQVGLSMALGAFLAGVLLAESEYRHELEADLEPFKGLLLGLFFIAVGMSVNLRLVMERPALIVGWVLGLVGVKAVLLYVLGKVRLKETGHALVLAVAISQGGEFAFVLFDLSSRFGIMDRGLQQLLVVVVSLSMAVTPVLYWCFERWVRPRLLAKSPRAFDEVRVDEEPPVIIAGFGRVGQVTARILRAKRIPFTAMDVSPEHVEFVQKFGNKIFYGDASRLELLRAAKADKARVFVLAIDDIQASLRTVTTVMQHFPNLTIFARARNRDHAYQLLGLGVKHIMRETYLSSLEMTVDVLQALGFAEAESRQVAERFREHDERMLLESYQHRSDEAKLRDISARSRAELEELFEKDAQQRVGQ